MHTELNHLSISELDNEKASQIIESCVHCGFCLATCPTYQIMGDELDSPRGRIYLIKSALENNQFSSKSLNIQSLQWETLKFDRPFVINSNRPFVQKLRFPFFHGQ